MHARCPCGARRNLQVKEEVSVDLDRQWQQKGEQGVITVDSSDLKVRLESGGGERKGCALSFANDLVTFLLRFVAFSLQVKHIFHLQWKWCNKH